MEKTRKSTEKRSLHGFCKAYQLPKTSVSRRAKEIGIDTSNGLSPGDCDRLRLEFDLGASDNRDPITVPSSSIQVLGNEQKSVLDSLAEKYAIKPFQAIDMNGDQASTLEIITLLATTSEALAQENARIRADIDERKAANQKVKQVATGIGAEIREQFEQNAELQDEAKQVAKEGEAVKKSLAQMAESLRSLSSQL